MSLKSLEDGVNRREHHEQQQHHRGNFTSSLRSILRENLGRSKDRKQHPLRGSIRFSDGNTCVCTPFYFLDENGEEIPVVFENAFEVVRAFCSKNQTQEMQKNTRWVSHR